MPYAALPDHRIPYDNDGTLCYRGTMAAGATTLMSDAELLEAQDNDYANVHSSMGQGQVAAIMWFFFPEQREITGIYARQAAQNVAINNVAGSNDTGNGLDGTWETASMPSGYPGYVNAFSWRDDIKPVSFTGPKKNLRISYPYSSSNVTPIIGITHLYGEAAAGQMAHDLIFINHDDTPGVAFTAPEDFGDQPLGTTVVRQWRLKNTSATKTATTINIQCNDSDFVISEDGVNWVVTINLASLAPGAESPTYFLRSTTPAPGAALGPRVPARIVVVCDAGFFG